MVQTIQVLFERDLSKLYNEVKSYDHEKSLWSVQGEIINCGGNLALHIVGNLNHFVGAILGDTGYVRRRDDEFGLKDIPRDILLSQIEETRSMVNRTLAGMKRDDLSDIYPVEVFGSEMTTGYFLVHLHGHLNYHLGQVNYHRRMINLSD